MIPISWFTHNKRNYARDESSAPGAELSSLFMLTGKPHLPILQALKSRDLFEDKLTPRAKLLTEIQKIEYITNVKVIEGSSSIEI